jgi:hypothetical protein
VRRPQSAAETVIVTALVAIREIFRLEPCDRLAFLVGYDHIDDDQTRVRANGERWNVSPSVVGTKKRRADRQVRSESRRQDKPERQTT